MARYIDADDLFEEISSLYVYLAGDNVFNKVAKESVLDAIDKQPTADVVEVKHGEWYLLDECANEGVYCSVCHKKVYKTDYANQKLKSNYCPNCGAKMDGGKE